MADFDANQLSVIHAALAMWRNYVETGNVLLSLQDAINSKQFKLCKVLDTNQKRLVVQLESLMEKVEKAQNDY